MKKQEEQKNELIVYMDEHAIEGNRRMEFIEAFSGFYHQAKEWNDKAKSLVITDVSQVEEMKQARVARIALRNIRTSVEKKRKELKEESLKTGKAIDNLANFLKELIEPTETYLEEQERFIERKEAEEKESIKKKREELLAPFEVNNTFFDLANMTEDLFQQLLSDSETLYKAKKEKVEKEEKERLMAEQRQKRVSQLYSLGFTFENGEFHNESAGLTIDEKELEKEEDVWNDVIKVSTEEIASEKKAREEAAQIALENERKKAAERERRINKMSSLGLSYYGSTQTYSFGNVVHVSANEVLDEMHEESFEEFIFHAQQAIAEDKRLNEEKKQRLYLRKKELFSLGLAVNGDNMVFHSISVGIENVEEMPSEEWKNFISTVKLSVEHLKSEMDNKMKAELDAKFLKFRERLLQDGYEEKFSGIFTKNKYSISKEKLMQFNNEEFENAVSEVNRLIEVESEAELGKPDKDKFATLLQELVYFRLQIRTKHQFRSKKYKTLHSNVEQLLDEVVAFVNEKI